MKKVNDMTQIQSCDTLKASHSIDRQHHLHSYQIRKRKAWQWQSQEHKDERARATAFEASTLTSADTKPRFRLRSLQILIRAPLQ